jgi:DNA-binding response OmpR family regulator
VSSGLVHDGYMRVLVVEDQAELADDIADGLRDQGIGADVAYDGSAGIEKALLNTYDVVVLDRDLPRIHGDAVCATLVGSPSQARILMLTAAGTVGDRVDGLNLGADDYLTKPFAFEELLARLRAVKRRAPVPQATKLQVGNLVLDPATREVSRGGTDILLTRTEYNLLERLMYRAGKVVPRRSLIEAVWGFDRDIEENTLDAFVRLLRTKIDTDEQPKLIHTVRGVGYMIRSEAQS